MTWCFPWTQSCSVDWTDTSLLLTTIATMATATVAVWALCIAGSQLRNAKAIREETSRPNVVMWLEVGPTSPNQIDVTIKNFGLTSAYDVELSFPDGWPKTAHAQDRNKPDGEWRVWESGIAMLAPGQSITRLFENGATRGSRTDLPERYPVSIQYTNFEGVKQRPSENVLDFQSLKQGSVLNTYGVHHIGRAFASGDLKGVTAPLNAVQTSLDELTETLEWLGRAQRPRSRVAGQRTTSRILSPAEKARRDQERFWANFHRAEAREEAKRQSSEPRSP